MITNLMENVKNCNVNLVMMSKFYTDVILGEVNVPSVKKMEYHSLKGNLKELKKSATITNYMENAKMKIVNLNTVLTHQWNVLTKVTASIAKKLNKIESQKEIIMKISKKQNVIVMNYMANAKMKIVNSNTVLFHQ